MNRKDIYNFLKQNLPMKKDSSSILKKLHIRGAPLVVHFSCDKRLNNMRARSYIRNDFISGKCILFHLYINKKRWLKTNFMHQIMVLLHEIGHSVTCTGFGFYKNDAQIEYKAEKWALLTYKKKFIEGTKKQYLQFCRFRYQEWITLDNRKKANIPYIEAAVKLHKEKLL